MALGGKGGDRCPDALVLPLEINETTTRATGDIVDSTVIGGP